jgi:enoyl-CoA hydratase/carnithine racemase
MIYETILYAENGPVGTLMLNRPDDGNMFTETVWHEVRDCVNLSDESHELGEAFAERRALDPEKFGH